MKINVLHLKIPISNIVAQFNENGQFTAHESVGLMDRQIDFLIDF